MWFFVMSEMIIGKCVVDDDRGEWVSDDAPGYGWEG